MTLKLNNNHQVVWRDPATMQIGLGGKQVVLSQVTSGQEKFIDALYFGVAENQLEAVAMQNKLPLDQAKELVGKLQDLMLQEPAAEDVSGNANGQRKPGRSGALAQSSVQLNADSASAEITAASLANSTDGQRILLERGRRVIHIDELSGPGAMLALALVSAGVGGIVSHDQEPVSQFDVGANAYPAGLIGHSRIDALRLMVEAGAPGAKVLAGTKLKQWQLDGIHAAVVTGQQVIDPKRYSRWLNRGVPHLAIVFGATGLEVTGLVRPGFTGCLNCWQLARGSEDPNWAVVSSQLMTSNLRFDSGAARLMACSLAVRIILDALDGNESGSSGSGGEFSGPQAGTSDARGEPSTKRVEGFSFQFESAKLGPLVWQQQEDCGCVLIGVQQASYVAAG